MEGSTVYFTDFRCPVGTSLTEKLRRLCLAAGIRNIDMDGRFVAIKMHFGELGNLAYLLYPPGIPLIVPGEVVNVKLVEQIKEYKNRNYEIVRYDKFKIVD